MNDRDASSKSQSGRHLTRAQVEVETDPYVSNPFEIMLSPYVSIAAEAL
jgi:hypothetical protein